MKRIITCAAITAVIIGFSVFSLMMLRSSNEELYRRVDRCLESYFSDSSDTAERVEELEDYWGEYYAKVSFLTRSSTLDDISYSVAKLEPLLKEDSDEFVSELNSIRFWAYLVYESQIPHWRSVF